MAARLLVALLLSAAAADAAWINGFSQAEGCDGSQLPAGYSGSVIQPNPYSIDLDETEYELGKPITGRVTGLAFKGLSLQAQFASPTTTSPAVNGAQGTFSPQGFISVRTETCTASGAFLTNAQSMDTDRYSFSWTPPSAATDEIAFFAIIIFDDGNYARVRSAGIKRKRAYTDWTGWGACSATCGEGVQVRTRTCLDFCTGVTDADEKESRPCIIMLCPGVWGFWTQWSSCSRTCGPTGETTRTRQCPSAGTVQCPGVGFERKECFQGNCLETWNAWSLWSSCNPTCGPGASKVRTRDCPVADSCGAGAISETSQEGCNNIACPSGQLSQWTAWTTCSRTCGGGTQRRTRFCIRQPCSGPLEDNQGCNTFPCGGGNQGNWGMWTSCSIPCGQGTATRRWICSAGQDCLPVTPQSKPCTGLQCSGQWHPWSAWSECDLTCGGGRRTRTRQCPVGECRGEAIQTDNIICNAHPCYDGWSAWTGWTPCSVTCGEGYQLRERVCQRGVCADGSPNIETKACHVPYCQNTWSLWGSWEECSVTCGAGLRMRKRHCLLPGCTEPPQREWDSLPCNTFPCPEKTWGEWSTWSGCSATCGVGKRERARYCYARDCPGDPMQEEACAINDCKDDTPVCHKHRPYTQEDGLVPICWAEGLDCPLGFECVMSPTTHRGVCCPRPSSCPHPLTWHDCRKECRDDCDDDGSYCSSHCRRGCYCPYLMPFRLGDKCVSECPKPPKPPKPLPDVTCPEGEPGPGTCVFSSTTQSCDRGYYCEVNSGEKLGRCCKSKTVIKLPSGGVRPRPEVFGVLLTLVVAVLNALL